MRYLAGSWQTPANKEINSSTAIEGKLILHWRLLLGKY